MSWIERIQEMLMASGDSNRVFPATILYNEGWLLRLVLDWFSREADKTHPLQFVSGARWFSEALLPSQFFARSQKDQLAEGWTHADGVIGHFGFSGSTAEVRLADDATQMTVTEAKLFAKLSPGVSHAGYFDQAARNVACLAEVLHRTGRRPYQFTALGFLVLAPAERIDAGVFEKKMTKQSIRDKVCRRVSEYGDPAKDRWLLEWFLPTLTKARVECLSWESIIHHVNSLDSRFGADLSEFYNLCLQFNRSQGRQT